MMKNIQVVYIVVICFVCFRVSESALFDSIFLNPGRQQNLLTTVDAVTETCFIVPKQHVWSRSDNTLKERETYADAKIKALAVFAKGNFPFPSGLEPACSNYSVAFGLYPVDVIFLELSGKISKTRRLPSFCILSTDGSPIIGGKFWCDESVNKIYRTIVRDDTPARAYKGGFTDALASATEALSAVGDFVGAFGSVVGSVLGLFNIGHDEPPPDKTPPRFTSCPHVANLMIPRGQTTVHVNIPRPTYADDRDGPGNCQLNESPTLNGMDLPAGSYEVTFTVSDSSGNHCSGDCACKVSFTVGGASCTVPTTLPPNIASISCTPNVAGPPVWGTVCQYSCLPGYQMSGGTTRTCEMVGGTGVWVPTNAVDCGESTCDGILTPQHGTVSCTNENKYRSVCQVECEAGYLPEDQNRVAAMCQADSVWDVQLTRCKDIQPPIFVSCPTDIVAFADRSRETAVVTWEQPTAVDKIDNIDMPASVHLSEGSRPGSTFTRGQHLIKYTATDASLNEALCSFKVDVQVITCPPIRYTLKAELSCPNGYVYGSTCTFGCETGYPVIGPTSFSCERDYNSNEPVGYWDWGFNRTKPFCKIVPCPTLRPPDNGALACDGWAYGTFCLIQCNDQWDVPLDTPERYVCETLSGTWNPDDDVPNCALPRDPDSMNLPSELYYYSGDCRDPETQVQIQENFIAILNSSDYSHLCQLFVECAAENVVVYCGNVTTRSGQPSYQLQVKFDLSVKVKEQTDQHTSYIDLENTLFSMADKIDEGVKEGKFSLNNVTAIDLEVQPDSFVTSQWTNLVCEPGYQPDYDTYTCKGCPKGSYFDTDKGVCEKCQAGQFQDEDGQLTCKPCPLGTWTVKNGSRSMDLCLDTCQPGWYSDTGMEPCAQCEMGHYQAMSGQKQCHRCPSGQTTTTFGAKAMNECKSIDLVLNVSSSVQLTETPSDLQGITLSLWIRPHLDSAHGTIFYLGNESNILFAIRKQESLEVALASTVLSTGIPLDGGRWHSLVVTLRDAEKDCKVYIDGVESWSQSLPNFASTVFPALNTNIVLGDAVGGSLACDISALSVWNGGALPESTILQMSQSCSYDDTDAVVTWTDVLTSTRNRITQRLPSICDDHNDCNPNPCGDHAAGCWDDFGFYTCVCEAGYTGTHCDVNINDCHEGSCKNGGTCVDGVANYTCVCSDGFTGRLCEREIVNGGWGQWTDWTPCSATCGNGTRQRSRQCNNPPPEENGNDCIGHFTESGTCSVQSCPSCLELKQPFGAIMNCYRNDTEDRNYCQIDCALGLEFSETPHLLYTCGPESQYKWNHQTENNPLAILPSCAHGRIPSRLSIDYKMKYPDLYCTSPGESRHIKDAIKEIGAQNVQDVDCVKRKTCHVTLQVLHCDLPGDNLSPASLGIVLFGDVNGTIDLGDLYEANGNMSNKGQEAITRLSNTIIDLTSGAEEIKNKSKSNDFAVVIDGQSFAVDANRSEVTLNADCQPPMVAKGMLCVYCAPGTYYQNKKCTKCPKGSFQELEGQMSCISCPEGFITAGVGADHSSDCSYEHPEIQPETEQAPVMTTGGSQFTITTKPSSDPDNFGETKDDSVDDTSTTIAVAVVIPIVLVAVIGVIVVGVYMYRRKSGRTDSNPRKDKRLLRNDIPKRHFDEGIAMQAM
ncbi:PREDICTED: sushi, von Willebrand factor type A, EGF and pentraxin domain-containing protein 1-like [Branchiostoma belcheri]|uniref:Sushi, von Willebrand factor type A, EGF and pentraxin domain-containing protein 1-like n=1 Tax=Branchiostoma belcheri TaxID=7741 RepID=A0A6P4XIW5_BRABE|nr:PREDICTED: sushi, von Willebrand factor type A, EGF and pentraxin domain-containing protein 1-like [Branchiostoma belcheri]